ncbi:hypothetical protein [Sandaracinus amylolyticus]|uniref:Outer membrane protein beta-barrel domain-containing protein n=1 Tax=Sandaracinus amylolyticus TaxID=927083 RepID=A0A0F6YP36_9BACT|nr:hypothetical protein [Sandaracinus amylolyticus]AKF11051.1 hypothetical protein DB32_008200 [Sandaracinus amylolyticus]
MSRTLVATLVVVVLVAVSTTARAQLDPELGPHAEPEPESDGGPPGGRDETRLRWGFMLGAFGSSVFWLDVPVWEARGLTWFPTDETQTFDVTTGGFVATLQVGVQTEELAGIGILRGCFGPGVPTHLSLSAVAELTLLDWLQLAMGPALDVVHLETVSPMIASATRALARELESGQPDISLQSAGVGFGLEMRISAATGGGPYERRGFVFASFLHMTFLEREVIVLGGLELGFQSY